jgi:hypothetical protein
MVLVLDPKQDQGHLAVDMAKVFEQTVNKRQSYDGQSIVLEVSLPQGLDLFGISEISTRGYKPTPCKLEEYRVPVSEERKKQLEEELTLGSVRFKMNCTPESESESEPMKMEMPF